MALHFDDVHTSENKYRSDENKDIYLTLEFIVEMLIDTKQENRALNQQRHQEYLAINEKLDRYNSSTGRKIDRLTYFFMGILATGAVTMLNLYLR